MKIIDISRELFTTPVYPGDPAPSFERLRRIDHGDGCNLSAFYTGSHSATLDRIAPRCRRMLLLKGNGQAFLSQSAAFALAQEGFTLVGTDAQSVAAYGDETDPHEELLGAGVVLLEGLDLSRVEPGEYTLAAFPLYVKGLEAALTRAVLLVEEERRSLASVLGELAN